MLVESVPQVLSCKELAVWVQPDVEEQSQMILESGWSETGCVYQ